MRSPLLIIRNRANLLLSHRVCRNLSKQYKTMGGGAVSILGNNCVAGMFCHDLGLRFDTPTINLAMSFHDFLLLAENLPDCLSTSIQPVERNMVAGANCPCGKIMIGKDQIVIKFVHYHSFEEAEEKWKQRAARYVSKHAFLMISDNSNASIEDIKRFRALHFPKICYYGDPDKAADFGEDGVLCHGNFRKGFNVTDFSGWNGGRYYHTDSEKVLRILAKASERHHGDYCSGHGRN